jgi:nucleoid DNA-binding protein
MSEKKARHRHSDVIRNISMASNVPQSVVRAILELHLQSIVHSLKERGSYKLKGIGVLHRRELKGREMFIPSTKKKQQCGGGVTVRYTPSRALRLELSSG